ncbi:hypothetical protein MTO96_001810 [Rhipicephalus appendiculatus]
MRNTAVVLAVLLLVSGMVVNSQRFPGDGIVRRVRQSICNGRFCRYGERCIKTPFPCRRPPCLRRSRCI